MKLAVLDVNPMARNKIFMALLMSLPKLMNVLLILLLLLILYSLTLRAVDLENFFGTGSCWRCFFLKHCFKSV